MAEFFGDHMVVNGMIWPKEDVEPRNYRLHLLNGTDSRFMAIRFRSGTDAGRLNRSELERWRTVAVLCHRQRPGSGSAATPDGHACSLNPVAAMTSCSTFQTGRHGTRVIMENIGGDEPFGGDIPGTAGLHRDRPDHGL